MKPFDFSPHTWTKEPLAGLDEMKNHKLKGENRGMSIKGIAKVMTMLALVASISVPALAGAVGGMKRGQFSVGAGYTDTLTQNFYGGQLASVYVRGDGDTDLDVYVYDAAGNLITRLM
jgi:hypothetical protein